ncbi:MAG: PH domain-containing protein [Chloroflexota bacterium]|nr:PH domain-containing protein [Chloroflexota bacterium]
MVDGADVEYDKKDQLDQITPWILGSERLYAVFDCRGAGTGFIAVTNKRLMFYDKAFMRKRKALTSVPFSKITAVSSVDEGRGLFGATSELVVKTGSEEFEFEFRGGDKAERAYKLIMGELLQNET